MERFDRSQQDEAMLLPFSGLGHDMSCVQARAALCEFKPVPTGNDSDGVQPLLPEALPACKGYGSGFSLLIALGREIRGR